MAAPIVCETHGSAVTQRALASFAEGHRRDAEWGCMRSVKTESGVTTRSALRRNGRSRARYRPVYACAVVHGSAFL